MKSEAKLAAQAPTLIQIEPAPTARQPRPEWLRVRVPGGENFQRLRRMTRDLELHTVCESARCPNIAECWNHGTATFMILGNLCTRRCGFCAVPKGKPLPIDLDEPRRVGEAVARLQLQHAVITSVNRDDDNLGGARIFAQVIAAIRERVCNCTVEVLIPDFRGSEAALRIVVEARPEILNHNTETVPGLYRFVRPGAKFERSLELLRSAKRMAPGLRTKSGLMLGLGESEAELLDALRALAATGCDILTLGQYLRPSRDHLPVKRLYTPAEFDALRGKALAMGFRHVESGPLVRSSYHAHEQARSASA
ncbi:MAG TPA: lipoyl synthase [Terriglobales bacterium]|nr:lipoyl synthase [Terriglobales bacterium]